MYHVRVFKAVHTRFKCHVSCSRTSCFGSVSLGPPAVPFYVALMLMGVLFELYSPIPKVLMEPSPIKSFIYTPCHRPTLMRG